MGANNSTKPADSTTTNAQKSGDANISTNSTKVESSETIKQGNIKTLNNKEANKEEDNKAAIPSFIKFDGMDSFGGFGGGSFGGGGAGGSF